MIQSRRLRAVEFGCAVTLFWVLGVGPAFADFKALKDSFNLGYTYGNATKITALFPDMSAEARHHFNSYMQDAAVIANRLNVKLNTNPPVARESDTDKFYTISSIAIERAGLMRTALEARRGARQGLLLWLGFNGAWAPETFSRVTGQQRQKMASQMVEFCAMVQVPTQHCTAYSRILETGDFRKSTEAMFVFAREVNRHFEAQFFGSQDGYRILLSAWRLGEKLSLASLGQTRARQPEDKAAVGRLFAQAREIADAMGIPLGALPHEATTDSARDTAASLHYILVESGETVGHALRRDYGRQAEACFEFSIKAPMLALFYDPSESGGLGEAVLGALSRAGPVSGVPRELWTPLITKVRGRAPYPEVKAEVSATLRRVEAHLLSKTY